MTTENLTVTRNNHLIQSSYSLTLDERRVVELAIAKIKFGEDAPAEIEITGEEFAEAFGVDLRNAYAQLHSGVDDLYERSVELIGQLSPESITRFRIVDRADYIKDEGRVVVSFTKYMKPYLLAKKEEGNYTTYNLLHVKRLNSAHAARLYELLMRFKDNGWREDNLDTLKQLFGVQNKYSEWYEFDRNVIKPSVKNLNQSSNYNVSYTTQKRGRKIYKIRFEFKLKDQPLLDL